jgi:hypothetical protein
MANKIADARRSLIRAKEAAEQRLVEIDKERREIRASLKSLDAAIKAIGGSNKTQPAKLRSPAIPSQDEPGFGTDATT